RIRAAPKRAVGHSADDLTSSCVRPCEETKTPRMNADRSQKRTKQGALGTLDQLDGMAHFGEFLDDVRRNPLLQSNHASCSSVAEAKPGRVQSGLRVHSVIDLAHRNERKTLGNQAEKSIPC